MMQKKSFFFVFIVLYCFSSFAQPSSTTPINSLMEDPAATKFRNLYNRSDQTLIPDSIINILKDHAFKNQLILTNVLKNKFVFSVIYNPEISISEKVESLDYLMKLYDVPSAMIPMILLKNLKRHFLSQTKNDD